MDPAEPGAGPLRTVEIHRDNTNLEERIHASRIEAVGGELGRVSPGSDPDECRIDARTLSANCIGLTIFAAIVSALSYFVNPAHAEHAARPRRVPGEPGHRTRLFAISADGARVVTMDLEGSLAMRDAQEGVDDRTIPEPIG